MELRQLRYFLAVAEHGNFSRAAESLHVSQPPLSNQIRALEQELGVRLFERSNRGATLTTAGRVFFERTRAITGQLEHAKIDAIRAVHGDVGILSIGFVSIADYGILPPALKLFRASHPAIEVRLYELTTDIQIRELRAARLDLGIALAPVNEAGLEFEAMLREELVLAAPAGHSLAKGDGPIDLRALAAESFIVPPRDIAPGLHDLTLSHCRAHGFAPRITQQARQMQTVIGLVSCGMGFALVPASVRNLKRTGVRYLRLRGKAAFITLGLLRRQQADRALQERFVDALRSAAQGYGRMTRR